VEARLGVAREAATVGASIISRYFHEGVEMREKVDAGLVSDADTQAEHAIVDVIRRAFPADAVLAEEVHRDDHDAEHLWVVDPLDGTTNFAHGIPHFSVSIAYYRNGQPECGVVHNPIRGDWFTAVRGRGAMYGDRAVRVSPVARLEETLVGVGFYYDRGAMMEATLKAMHDLFKRQVRGIRRIGTASLDLCQVGIGWFGAFFEYELSPWDFAAGRLFVEEAGGRVTTCRGEPLPLQPSTVLASNGVLHETMLEIVSAHEPRGVNHP
jgi:myo-inositol-1(or 4)-monophosphatase